MSNPAVRGPAMPPVDRFQERLGWAVLASALLNAMLWSAVAAVARHPMPPSSRPVEVTRIILPPAARVLPRPRPQVHHAPKPVPKPIPRPKPVVHVKPPPTPRPQPRPTPQPVSHKPPPVRVAPAPPPEGAHNRLLTAPDKGPAKPDQHEALTGGNAALGKPTGEQNPGNAVVNPPVVVKKPTPPAPPPPPPVVKPAPVVKPEPVAPPPPPPVIKPTPVVKPEPVVVPPPPPPPVVKPEPPKRKKGPSREAEPTSQVKPEIPDDLKKGEYRSFVRVKVEINEDGSFTPVLRTSSGNPEIDRRVLESLKRWRWKPALKDGEPVRSTELFKFEFLVE
jgi:TonB family protein